MSTATASREMVRASNEELCLLAQAGNADAVDVLLLHNAGFISRKAWHFYEEKLRGESAYSISQEDLFQEAQLAFWKAIYDYDPGRKAKLTTFAGITIWNALHDYWDRYCSENQYERSFLRAESLVRDEPGASNDGIQNVDVEAPGEEPDPLCLETAVDEYRRRPEPILLEKETREEIYRALGALPPREETYLCYRFGYPHEDERSLRETAEHFSLRESRAKKIESEALAAFRKGLHW